MSGAAAFLMSNAAPSGPLRRNPWISRQFPAALVILPACDIGWPYLARFCGVSGIGPLDTRSAPAPAAGATLLASELFRPGLAAPDGPWVGAVAAGAVESLDPAWPEGPALVAALPVAAAGGTWLDDGGFTAVSPAAFGLDD